MFKWLKVSQKKKYYLCHIEKYMKFTLQSLYKVLLEHRHAHWFMFCMCAFAVQCRGTKTWGHKSKNTYYLVLYRKYADSWTRTIPLSEPHFPHRQNGIILGPPSQVDSKRQNNVWARADTPLLTNQEWRDLSVPKFLLLMGIRAPLSPRYEFTACSTKSGWHRR